jgi:Helix-turn-helix domain
MTAVTEHAPLLYTVREVLTMLRMSRTQFYAQVNAGRLRIVKQGSSTRVTTGDLAAYVRLLQQEAEASR